MQPSTTIRFTQAATGQFDRGFYGLDGPQEDKADATHHETDRKSEAVSFGQAVRLGSPIAFAGFAGIAGIAIPGRYASAGALRPCLGQRGRGTWPLCCVPFRQPTARTQCFHKANPSSPVATRIRTVITARAPRRVAS